MRRKVNRYDVYICYRERKRIYVLQHIYVHNENMCMEKLKLIFPQFHFHISINRHFIFDRGHHLIPFSTHSDAAFDTILSG